MKSHLLSAKIIIIYPTEIEMVNNYNLNFMIGTYDATPLGTRHYLGTDIILIAEGTHGFKTLFPNKFQIFSANCEVNNVPKL